MPARAAARRVLGHDEGQQGLKTPGQDTHLILT